MRDSPLPSVHSPSSDSAFLSKHHANPRLLSLSGKGEGSLGVLDEGVNGKKMKSSLDDVNTTINFAENGIKISGGDGSNATGTVTQQKGKKKGFRPKRRPPLPNNVPVDLIAPPPRPSTVQNNGHPQRELKPVYRNKKTCCKHQRSLRDYPFKKRRLYQLDNPSNSNHSKKGSAEDGSSLGASSGFAAQDPSFQAQDSRVKLKIKSFRVPEFFIEIPETATVSSLKRTVMEAVTAIFGGELHVGVMLQGKRIRDDSKTLLQTGICHDNKLDALGFTLEPNQLQIPPSLSPEDQSVVPPPGTPKSLTRYSPPQTVANQVSDALLGSPMTNSRNTVESDHDSAPSPPDMSVDTISGSDSRALVTVPAINPGALGVVPMRKSKRAEVAQRRIRRPFSVSEVEALVEAVEKLGTGRWRDVKLRAFDDAKHRTYVDLKDKWKTLVHTARISPQQRRGEPVPQELLDRVLEAHGYWSHHQAKNQFKHQLQTETCRLL